MKIAVLLPLLAGVASAFAPSSSTQRNNVAPVAATVEEMEGLLGVSEECGGKFVSCDIHFFMIVVHEIITVEARVSTLRGESEKIWVHIATYGNNKQEVLILTKSCFLYASSIV